MQQQTTNDTRRTPVRRGLRAQIAQGALALSALLGAIAVTDATGSRAGESLRPKAAAEVVTRRPALALPTAQFVAEAVAPKAEPAPSVDSAVVLASHFEKKGYEVPETLASTIAKAAEKHGIDLKVAFGLVRAESGFDDKATSHVGAIGLTQLMPRTAAWLKKGTTRSDLRDPATNADIGFGYLSDLIEKYDGSLKLALLAYNRGPGTVDKILKRGGNPDNGYATKVLSM